MTPSITQGISVNDFKQIVRGRVEEICAEWGKPKDSMVYRSKAFVKFFASIYLEISPEDIDPYMNMAGSGDLSVDFAYEDTDRNKLTVIQGNYIGLTRIDEPGVVSRGHLQDFSGVHARLTDNRYVLQHGNEAIKEIFYDFSDRLADGRLEVEYVYATTARSGQRVLDDFQKAVAPYSQLQDNVNFELFDFDKCKALYDRYISRTDPIPDEVSFPIVREDNEALYFEDRKSLHSSLTCVIKGTTLYDIYARYKDSILAYNIRSYLKATAVNKGIRETIIQEPENFFYYNNGVSAICTSFEVDAERDGLQCTARKFQIINGAQTTCEIYRLGRDRRLREKLKDLRILLRLTHSEEVASVKGLNRKIIEYNNTQNRIYPADFRSNDAIQVNIQKKINDFRLKGHRRLPFFYERKRGEALHKQGVRVIHMPEATKAYYAFKYNPYDVVHGDIRLFSVEEDGKYFYVFGNDEKKPTDDWTNERLSEFLAACGIYFYVKEWIKDSKRDVESKDDEVQEKYGPTHLCGYHFIACFGTILENYPEDKAEVHRKIIESFVEPGRDHVRTSLQSWFAKFQEEIARAILYSKRSEGFSLRKWKRSAKEWDMLKKSIVPRSLLSEYPIG